jgi:predicted HTH transcriptional regulator
VTANSTEFDEFLSEPRESLDVEFKEWLDLNDHDHSAIVAKEVIALANHGGGYLIVGFEEQAGGTFTPAIGRPPNLEGWSQDRVQSVVAKYIDPMLQCRVVHRVRPGTTDLYPIVAVVGGHRLPIRAKRGSPDGRKLVPHRVYIRRAGPASEEPQTAEEWDRLLERCLQNRRAELLEAMRAILAGTIPTAPQQTPSRAQELLAFEGVAIARWEAKVARPW